MDFITNPLFYTPDKILPAVTDGMAKDYWSKLALAASISAFSLASGSQEGVIGSMIVAPLAVPIIALCRQLVKDPIDTKSASGCIAVVALSTLLMFAIGLAVPMLFDMTDESEEMKRRHNLKFKETLLTALVVGCGFIYINATHQGKGVMAEGIGIAIAISFLPPIVNAGTTLGMYLQRRFVKGEPDDTTTPDIIYNSLRISGLNALSVVLVTTFGFYCFDKLTIHNVHKIIAALVFITVFYRARISCAQMAAAGTWVN